LECNGGNYSGVNKENCHLLNIMELNLEKQNKVKENLLVETFYRKKC
jgi:hypothetical protein